jgi:hypothetical protein
MGRYRAEIALSYGEDSRKSDTRVIYFWVLNIKTISIILGSIILALALMIASIKLYIRKAIINTQKELGLYPEANKIPEIAVELKKAEAELPVVVKKLAKNPVVKKAPTKKAAKTNNNGKTADKKV